MGHKFKDITFFFGVGSRREPFLRFQNLFKKMLLHDDFKNSYFIGQLGIDHGLTNSNNATIFDFANHEQIIECIKKADICIIHAGTGYLIDCIQLKKKIILFPRLEKFREVADNHQIIFSKFLKANYNLNYALHLNEILLILNSHINNLKLIPKNDISKNLPKFIDSLIQKFHTGTII